MPCRVVRGELPVGMCAKARSYICEGGVLKVKGRLREGVWCQCLHQEVPTSVAQLRAAAGLLSCLRAGASPENQDVYATP